MTPRRLFTRTPLLTRIRNHAGARAIALLLCMFGLIAWAEAVCTLLGAPQ